MSKKILEWWNTQVGRNLKKSSIPTFVGRGVKMIIWHPVQLKISVDGDSATSLGKLFSE